MIKHNDKDRSIHLAPYELLPVVTSSRPTILYCLQRLGKFTTFLCSSDVFEACLSSLKMSLQCVIADLINHRVFFAPSYI